MSRNIGHKLFRFSYRGGFRQGNLHDEEIKYAWN